MRTIIGQIFASTKVDLQGEQLALADLVKLKDEWPDPFALNFQHDMAVGYVGLASNLRIEQAPTDPTVHYLKVDIQIDESNYDTFAMPGMGGFSWSLTMPLERNYAREEAPEIMIYLPWPHQNDPSLIHVLTSSPHNILVRSPERGSCYRHS